jgi:hypothetical protein
LLLVVFAGKLNGREVQQKKLSFAPMYRLSIQHSNKHRKKATRNSANVNQVILTLHPFLLDSISTEKKNDAG